MKNLYIFFFCLLCLVACNDDTKVQSVKLDPSELELEIGESFQIEMIISPISAIIYNPTSWQSSDPNVAQVDNKGNVTAIYAGECIITGKTKHCADYCKVTVTAPNFDFDFTKAIVFDDGIDAETGRRNLILRLHEETLSIDSTGVISGNGNFLNINLFAPANSTLLPAGQYLVSDTIADFTILPGALIQEGNSYYATGSYLGQYTDNGLSVLFFTEGNIKITEGYSILCSFLGSKTEKIDATFSGEIPLYDTSKEKLFTTIEYSDVAIEEFYISNSNFNHFKISFSANDTTVSFVARAPISMSSLPLGSYYTSNEAKAYTLITEYCTIAIGQETSQITTATLKINENNFNATFTDEQERKYLLRSANTPKNINKLKLKNFVY